MANKKLDTTNFRFHAGLAYRRIGNVKEHHPDAVGPLAAQESRHGIRPVAEFARRLFDFFLGSWCDVPRQRRIVQDNGNRSRREAAQVRDIPHGYRIGFAG